MKLSASQSELAAQALKNFYIFDLPGIEEGAQEKKVEEALYLNIGKFLDELGPGFAFMGRQCQYHLEIGKQDFYIDLLFYHCKLHCFVVIELKDKKFGPEDVGNMNLCLSAVDDQMKQADDNPSIGLILCKTKDNVVAKYALEGVSKPIGVSEYKLRK
ncbi:MULTISPECIES: PDDEXK nuclease domain-containing protein [Francisella]|uniref:PDDEXK nuclease domain-containing protein n=1 Tax=Francisella TaxID=262 RepID=UPI0027D26E88|nr:PDDEXK nuclease domain-containing protein [Francisella opportunistica]